MNDVDDRQPDPCATNHVVEGGAPTAVDLRHEGNEGRRDPIVLPGEEGEGKGRRVTAGQGPCQKEMMRKARIHARRRR
jgi:hypothetical protein